MGHCDVLSVGAFYNGCDDIALVEFDPGEIAEFLHCTCEPALFGRVGRYGQEAVAAIDVEHFCNWSEPVCRVKLAIALPVVVESLGLVAAVAR